MRKKNTICLTSSVQRSKMLTAPHQPFLSNLRSPNISLMQAINLPFLTGNSETLPFNSKLSYSTKSPLKQNLLPKKSPRSRKRRKKRRKRKRSGLYSNTKRSLRNRARSIR